MSIRVQSEVLSRRSHAARDDVFDRPARTYELEYRLGDEPEKHRLLTTLGHIERFECDHAVATRRDGAFGWEWVDTVDPAHTEHEPAEGESSGPDA